MPLWTTYLAFLKKGVGWVDGKPHYISAEDTIKKARFVYVMRNRGNNAVAPNRFILEEVKKGNMTWERYAELYLKNISCEEAGSWIQNIANEAISQHIVLICFEKDASHCHRTLLAKEIIHRRPEIKYEGELHQYP